MGGFHIYRGLKNFIRIVLGAQYTISIERSRKNSIGMYLSPYSRVVFWGFEVWVVGFRVSGGTRVWVVGV